MNTKAGYIAIVGKPNAGKSTLMNKIVGAKLSIVTPKPQTTRKKVLGIYTGESTQMVFLDTPGILKPRYEMQKSMMDYVDSAMDEADIIAVIVDVEKYAKGKYFPLGFKSALKNLNKPKIAIINKIDTAADRKEILPVMGDLLTEEIFDEIVPISALNETNIAELISVLEERLPEGPFFYEADLISSQPERFFVAELIRERVFTLFEDEVPYSTEVNIIEFKERENGKWYISADIIVERDTQKRIIIGSKGEKIKEIGQSARLEIEEHVGLEIFLNLFVKVRKDWRDNKGMLKSFGY